MATELKLRRGTTAQHSTFTGGLAEVTVDSDKDTVVVHDGATAGGFPLAKETGSNIAAGNLSYTGTLTGSTGVLNIGSGQFYKDASGNVGIGTAAPVGRLDAHSNNDATLQNGDYALRLTRPLNENGTGVGIGFNVSNLSDNIGAKIVHFRTGTASQGGLAFYTKSTTANGDLSQERMRIDSAGDVLVGQSSTPAPGLGNTVDGIGLRNDGYFSASRGALAAGFNRNNSNGAVISLRREGSEVGSISVTTTATSYNESSDYRLKENIVDAPEASSDIDGIQVRSFDWKANGEHQKYGMIAQELDSVCPRAVTKGETEDDMWGVDYSKLVPMLVKEVQSLRARVAQLEGN